MGTIIDKLKYLKTTKSNIKDSINEKGVEVTDTTTFREYAEKISEITAGGEEEEKFQILVIDYTGDIIDEKWLKNGETYTLPEPPTHDRLVFAEWACTQEIVDNKVTVNEKDIHIGPIYDTKSGATEIDIEIGPYQLNRSMTLHVDSNFYQSTIDWGDGSAIQSITASNTTHTYTTIGNYTILLKNNGSGNLYLSGYLIQDTTRMSPCVQQILFANNTRLQSYVCGYMYSMRYVSLPSNFSYIGTSMFSNCRSLKALIKPNRVSTTVEWIGSSAINYCYNLKYFIYGYDKTDSVQHTFSNWIDNCFNLVSIILPDNISTITRRAFYGMRNLKRCFLPKNVTSIGTTSAGELFSQCNSLELVNLENCNNITYLPTQMFNGCYNLKNVILPNSIETFYGSVFNNTGLESIKLSNSLHTLSQSAFSNSRLREIEIPASVTNLHQANYLFNQCYNLQKVAINCDSSAIPTYFCQNCYSLKEFNINSTITSIEQNAFYYCYSLHVITGLESVVTIGNNAFYQCYSLSGGLYLRDAETIGQSSFSSCSSIEKVLFGKNIQTLNSSCLYSVPSLKLLDFSEALQIPTLASSGSISSYNSALQIVVPDNLYDDWIVATNWTAFADRIIKKSDYDLQQGG